MLFRNYNAVSYHVLGMADRNQDDIIGYKDEDNLLHVVFHMVHHMNVGLNKDLHQDLVFYHNNIDMDLAAPT